MSISHQVPSNLRSNPKLLLHELMSDHLIINKVLIAWACLIRGRPAAIDNFKLTVLNNFFEFIFHFLRLTSVPHLDVLDFSETESFLWVFIQLISDSGEHRPDRNMITHLISSRVILINSLLEAKIYLSCGNQMHSEIPFIIWFPLLSDDMLPRSWELSLLFE
jgi:hypothetical protein